MVKGLIVACVLVSVQLDRGVDVAMNNFDDMAVSLSQTVYTGTRSLELKNVKKTKQSVEQDLATLKKAVQKVALRIKELDEQSGFSDKMKDVSQELNEATYKIGNKISGEKAKPRV